MPNSITILDIFILNIKKHLRITSDIQLSRTIANDNDNSLKSHIYPC